MFEEARLDDQLAVDRFDARGSLIALAQSGAQVRSAARRAEDAGVQRLEGLRPRAVLVAAGGSSSAVADIFEAASRTSGAVPVLTCATGPLPGWVGGLDLVIAVSMSGRAAGTLELAAEAGRRGASLLTIGAPDSPLAEVSARARGIHVPIEQPADDAPSSRTSLWAQAAPALIAGQALGILTAGPASIDAIADVLDERAIDCRPSSEAYVNPAKILAVEISESQPILLGVGQYGAVAARRASAMFGRSGRVPIAAGALPHAASQIVACFDGPLGGGEDARDGRGGHADDIFADPYLDGPTALPLRLILLRDPAADDMPSDSPLVAENRLVEQVLATADDAGVRVSSVESLGQDPLARLASHIALTDFASSYLAIGGGYDPSDSPHVRLLRGPLR